MEIMPQILSGKVMHKRLFPKVNAFVYNMYYLFLPLSKINDMADGWRFGIDRPALMSFYRRDHGARDGSDLERWIRAILDESHIPQADGEITLVCLPRIAGYVFNPVSFWLCHDKAGDLRAVLYEVNNTFGERHSYLCAHSDRRIIKPDDTLNARKLFHVSPFLEREGYYRFKISVTPEAFDVSIDFFDADGRRKVLTALYGALKPANRSTLRRAFWNYPLITFKAIALIHWQACKLLIKRVKYVPKPPQNDIKLSHSSDITKI